LKQSEQANDDHTGSAQLGKQQSPNDSPSANRAFPPVAQTFSPALSATTHIPSPTHPGTPAQQTVTTHLTDEEIAIYNSFLTHAKGEFPFYDLTIIARNGNCTWQPCSVYDY